MIPKKSVTKAIKLMLSFLLFFPAVNKLKIATTNMVIGMMNSIRLTLMYTIPKTERNKARVCPKVKRKPKVRVFASL